MGGHSALVLGSSGISPERTAGRPVIGGMLRSSSLGQVAKVFRAIPTPSRYAALLPDVDKLRADELKNRI
jgi:hypothetical protein